MRVCHLIASNFAGGPEKQIVELSVRLQNNGWPVSIGSFREGRPEVEVLERAAGRDLDTFLIDTATPFSPAAVSQLRRQLERVGADVLVSHGYKANVVGWLATRRGDAVQIPVVRGFTAEDWKVRLYERVDRWVLSRCTQLIAVSYATRRMLEGHGLDGGRIEVVHNSVDATGKVGPLDLHREHGLPAGVPTLVAAGRLSPEKGHRFLIDALAQLAGGEGDAHLVILGEGRQRPALERQIRERGLRGRVLLAGFRRDALAHLAAADLVVNPSLSEGLPNVVLEAMSVRSAVVATDVGGVAEILDGPEVGWLVEAGRPEALARAIQEALQEPVRRDRIAAAGQSRVRAHFSFEEQRRRFQGVCEQALSAVC